MTDQHHIIPGRVGCKPLEGQLLMAKILYGPVGQFVTATFVIAGDKPIGRQVVRRPGFFQHPVDGLALTNVGDDDRIRAKTRQIKLVAVIMHQAAKYGPSKPLPTSLPATELGILPGVFLAGFKPFPLAVVPGGGHLFDVFIHFAATNIADVKRLTQIENLLVEKTAVHANDDRHIPAVVSFDFDHHMPNHIQHRIAVIGMLVPTAKHRIDNEAAPVHLQGLKSFFLFVGRLDTMPAQRIIVIHDHRIDTQLNDLGLGDLQTPEKKMLQKPPEQKHPRPGEGLEKPFDLMRRGHVNGWGLNTAGIAFILRKLIEIGQPPAGAIDKEAQYLLEKLCNGQAFAVFADGAEPAIEPAENLDVVQIGHEQGQARPAGQPVGGGFNTTNFEFLLPVIFAISVHRVLYLLGGVILVVTLAGFNKYYNILPDFKGLFLFKYRSL